MIEKNKKGISVGWIVLLIFSALISFSLYLRYFTQGKNIALFNPKGFIAQEQYNLMMFTIIVLLIIGIPAIILFFVTAYRFRESNPKHIKEPEATNNKFLVFAMWVVPIVFMFVISIALIPATHELAPQNAIASENEPMTIQVISLNWKWLFIYPDQNIATVNFVQIPINTPIVFDLTADESPMSSFWIPNLAGQLYSMTSHVNRINMIADTTGDFPGSSAEINGEGFAGMKFTTRVSEVNEFDQWVNTVRQSPEILDADIYAQLVEPSENVPPTFFSKTMNNIYGSVLAKYSSGHGEGH